MAPIKALPRRLCGEGLAAAFFAGLIQSFTFRLSYLPQTCLKYTAKKRHGFEIEMKARREAVRWFKCMEQL
jgi:hypothetical protein